MRMSVFFVGFAVTAKLVSLFWRHLFICVSLIQLLILFNLIEIYTTPLDRDSQHYKDLEAHAERLAKEISFQNSANPHLAEERGHQLAK